MYIIWATIGIFFLYLDFKKTSLIKLTLASTFLFCSIISFKFPENILYQVFSLPSFGMLFYFLIKTTLKKEKKDIEKQKNLDDFIGKIAIVKKDIGRTLSIDGFGLIEYNNQLWNAKSIDDKEIKTGKEVEIVSKENKIMNVKAITNAKK